MRERSESAGRKPRVGHAERSEDALLEELVERFAGGGFDHEAEHVGAEVGILVTAARLAAERRRR